MKIDDLVTFHMFKYIMDNSLVLGLKRLIDLERFEGVVKNEQLMQWYNDGVKALDVYFSEYDRCATSFWKQLGKPENKNFIYVGYNLANAIRETKKYFAGEEGSKGLCGPCGYTGRVDDVKIPVKLLGPFACGITGKVDDKIVHEVPMEALDKKNLPELSEGKKAQDWFSFMRF